ncbi:hypothetical protein [Hoeflea poritis]|uniref:Phage holin family protein n=1 Tax=Hoeflea poritis TaxID=2993659 RepID=A0ABT4VKD8_9HYPH|nr:hypothetical protein [Hoeflea poritis]MDA4845141.1 hypothetical protein [Hoeflea poritis]
MSNMKRNLLLLWRSERILAEARFKQTTRKMTLGVLAAISCLFAWGMFNWAGFFALGPHVGNAWAALIVGLADILIATLLILVSQVLKPAPEEEMVREVRDMALGEIGAEAEEVQTKLLQLRDDVEDVRANVADFVKRPLDVLSPSLIGPTLVAVSKLVKSRSK